MNIMLLGCSWGVPNYYGLPGDPPETHTEFLLKQLGHQVYNCSQNAASNMVSFYRAKDFMEGIDIPHPAGMEWEYIKGNSNTKIDLAIWFHTDPGRDVGFISTEDKSISTQLEEISSVIYDSFNVLFNELKCKVIIVGACADVHPCIDNYIKYDYLLPSWQQKLIGVSTGFFRLTTGLKVPSDEDITLTENAINVIDAMNKNRLIFPDGGHPGGIAHKELVELLNTYQLLG